MSSEPPADATAPVERRLATILIADVYGYSRMMGENEERTVQTLRGHRAVFEEMLKVHRGRLFNTAGDAILAEFPSAVEAVRCATEVQAALRTRNEHLPEDQRMWFRIGINLGDVVVQDGDLLGDGVNVAARIQTVADPGGVCISGSVYDQIQNKLTLSIRQLGERSFKNIARPVRTFAISDEQTAGGKAIAPNPARQRTALAASVIVALAAAIGVGYWVYRDRAEKQEEAARVAAKAEQDAAAQKEAKLAAELKSAQDALAQTEAAKRKAEEEKAAIESAQREAKLASELKAAKDALAKSQKPEPKAVAAAAPPAPAASADQYDGLYRGKVCKAVRDAGIRCWNALLTAQHGTLSASWFSRSLGNGPHAKGSIGPRGEVAMTLEAVGPGGDTVTGSMTGRWADKTITMSGNWSDGSAGNASLTWAPDAPPAAPVKSKPKSPSQ